MNMGSDLLLQKNKSYSMHNCSLKSMWKIEKVKKNININLERGITNIFSLVTESKIF